MGLHSHIQLSLNPPKKQEHGLRTRRPTTMEVQNDPRTEDIKKIGEFIKDIRMAMLTTVDENGQLQSRPMATQIHEFDGTLWFFTEHHSLKLDQLKADSQVNVAYSEPKHQRYLSLSGTATEVQDHDKMVEFWNPAFKAWFPKGLEDPELSLIKVTVNEAELWDTPSSKVTMAFGYAKAVITGQKYDAGDHEKMDLTKGYTA